MRCWRGCASWAREAASRDEKVLAALKRGESRRDAELYELRAAEAAATFDSHNNNDNYDNTTAETAQVLKTSYKTRGKKAGTKPCSQIL